MAISLTSPSLLFSQVCNCNKYLKVSREGMKQLVESSTQESGEHSAGERVGDPPSCALPWDSLPCTEWDQPPGPGLSQKGIGVPCHGVQTHRALSGLVYVSALAALSCPARHRVMHGTAQPREMVACQQELKWQPEAFII